MKRWLLLLVLLAGGCGGPPADFEDVTGTGYYYADMADKWLVVNYWATWCGPCIKEIPELNELAATHAQDIVVLGVNWDEPDGDDALAQARRMKIEFPVYRNEPAARLGINKPEVLPTTFVFAPGLKLVATLSGPQTVDTLLSTTHQ